VRATSAATRFGMACLQHRARNWRALALTQVHHGSRLSDSCEDGEALVLAALGWVPAPTVVRGGRNACPGVNNTSCPRRRRRLLMGPGDSTGWAMHTPSYPTRPKDIHLENLENLVGPQIARTRPGALWSDL